MKKITNAISSTEGLPIRYNLYYPENFENKLPVILFLHGFKGFKDWGTFPAVCESMAEEGFAVIAMNFSLNGIGDNPLKFDRLDLFSRETFSQDLDDVGSMIKAVKKGEISDDIELNPEKMGILGHSRGGQTAVAAAAEYDEIECLAAWSAVADYNKRWSEEMINDWQTKGVTEIVNGRTDQIMPMKRTVYDDAHENAARVIAINRVKELDIPSMFIHAKNDEAVSYKDAEQLFEACASEEKDIMLIPDTGHTFGGSHPFKGGELPGPLQKALKKTKRWFVDFLM